MEEYNNYRDFLEIWTRDGGRQEQMDTNKLNEAMEEFFGTYFFFEEAALLQEFIEDGDTKLFFDSIDDLDADEDAFEMVLMEQDDFFITDEGYDELRCLVDALEDLVAQKIVAVKKLFKV